jgi:hypothetical protein
LIFVVGLVSGTVFRAVGNSLFVLWPITWGISSASSTLQAGMLFGWEMVATSLVILVIQLGLIAYLVRRTPGRSRPAVPSRESLRS